MSFQDASIILQGQITNTEISASAAIATSKINFNVQSFQNLVKNGDFESWSGGANVVPDGWDSFYRQTGTSGRSTTSNFGTYSLQLKWDGTGGSPASLYDSTHITTVLLPARAHTVTLGVWVKASEAGVARVRIGGNNVGSVYSNYHTGGNTWEFLTLSITFTTSDTSFTLELYQDSTTTFSYFDGIILVEGSTVPAFSPRPLYDDGKSIQISSTTNVITLGGVFLPLQATTGAAPAYVKGGEYFDTTLNKLRVGGASVWETAESNLTATTGTYTGDNGTNRAVAHGLGKIPKYVIIAETNNITDSFVVGASLQFQGTSYAVTTADATNFYVGNVGDLNKSCNGNTRVYSYLVFG